DLLAGEHLRSGDRRIGRNQEVLAGDVVRAGEVHLRLPFVVDRVGGDHDVDLALLDEGFSVGRDGGDVLDPGLRHSQTFGDDLGDLDVEAFVGAACLQAEARLVGLD